MSILQGELNDTGMAERFLRLYGADYRFVPDLGFLVWTGTHWAPDKTRTVVERVCATVAQVAAATDEMADPKAADVVKRACATYGNTARLYAVAKRLESMAEIATTTEALNADPYALTYAGGTVDLRTGTARQHNRADLITRCAPAADEPMVTEGRWQTFLAEVFPDEELRDWVQRAVGCSVIGRQDDHVLFIAHGGGANGKGAFFGALTAALGLYYAAIPPTFLVESPNTPHPTEVADLMGKRMVVGDELPPNRKLDETRVKELTGGSRRIKARFMNKDFFEFAATWTLWICCNQKPRVTGTDNGFWRRARVVPFVRTFAAAEIDRDLPAKLAAERDSILRWVLDGAVAYCKDGLGICAAVQTASQAYRAEEDVFGQCLREIAVDDPTACANSSAIVQAVANWYTAEGHDHPPTGVKIGRELRARGYTEGRTSTSRYWQGIALPDRPLPPRQDWRSKYQEH